MKDNLFYICLFLVLIIFLAILLSHNNILFQILINLILTGSFLYIIYDYIISKKNIDIQYFKKMYNLNNKKNTDSRRNYYNLSNYNKHTINNKNNKNTMEQNYYIAKKNQNNNLNNNLNKKENINEINELNDKELNDKEINYKEINDKEINDKEIKQLIDEINYDNKYLLKNKDLLKNKQNQIKENKLNNNLENNTPIYDNLENLKRLNYYSSQGLNCAYDLQFNKDFSNFKDIYNLTGCNGDTKLANRMKFMSLKDKFAKEYRAAYDRTSIQHLFTDELNIEEKRIWWENPDIYDSVM